jgi:single-strand DNA-binding protein
MRGHIFILTEERKMNNLNSVLIEGVLTEDPKYILSPKTGLPQCAFGIASTRFYNDMGGMRKEVSCFVITVAGKLAENVKSLGYKGRGARVVGRLAEERETGRDGRRQSRVIIVAEHIEMKPEYGKKITHKEVVKAL